MRPCLMFMRVAVVVQLVLGIGFWTGRWPALVQAHMIIGVLYVLALWVIAIIAMRAHIMTGFAAFAIVWGLVVAGLGNAQTTIMVGDSHWIIRVVHLVVSLAAMPIAERLAGAVRAPRTE